ncbi:hypothetical protein HYPGJ_31585 [Hyphomicrobium sp. GJ21]|uniref:hypothetical protein n=1 Tax=Hyphomicrobium sp. GJ21 TaxID=113574 RepID=UPI000404F77E|nr:hypothetical protein [Hyphomicrobium sp. GJ21]CEJ88088.1 hypothetical protein HYPGJ_31585 [Hyphomicrobium sp. GJ21]
MPIRNCALCGKEKPWTWEEAFYNTGFDGGLNSQTEQVVAVLKAAELEVITVDDADNSYIASIRNKYGIELVGPHDFPGDDDPHDFLPGYIIDLLYQAFPPAPPSPAAPVVMMNAWQRAVCASFSSGDCAHLAHDRNWAAALKDCGDPLFAFLMRELSDAEDCEDEATALQRLQSARDDIEEAILAVEAVQAG